MKKIHYLIPIVLILGCQKSENLASVNHSIQAEFVNACVTNALKNNHDKQKVKLICECIYNISEHEYGSPQQWQQAIIKFNQTQTTDPKLQRITQRAITQCQSQN